MVQCGDVVCIMCNHIAYLPLVFRVTRLDPEFAWESPIIPSPLQTLQAIYDHQLKHVKFTLGTQAKF